MRTKHSIDVNIRVMGRFAVKKGSPQRRFKVSINEILEFSLTPEQEETLRDMRSSGVAVFFRPVHDFIIDKKLGTFRLGGSYACDEIVLNQIGWKLANLLAEEANKHVL